MAANLNDKPVPHNDIFVNFGLADALVEDLGVSGEQLEAIPDSQQSDVKSEGVNPPELNQHSLQCEVCAKLYKTKTTLRNHIRVKHKQDFRIVCNICDGRFLSNMLLREHTAKAHSDCGVCKCRVCGKVYKTYRGMREHVKEHEDTLCVCEFSGCEKSFPTQARLKRHALSHSKPVECDLCLKCMDSQSSLKKHKDVYHAQNPTLYKCERCTYTSLWRPSVKRHVATVHSDSRPHVCGKCGVGYKDKRYLFTHMKRDTCCKEKASRCWEDIDLE